MAAPKDSKIEKTLRKIVRQLLQNEEQVTVRVVRGRVEDSLGLEAGFFKDGDWKRRSKTIIEAAVQDPEGDAEQPVETTKESAKHANTEAVSSAGGADKAARFAPKPPQKTAPQVNGVKRKAPGGESAQSSTDVASSSANELPSKKAKVTASDTDNGDSSPEAASSNTGSEESSQEESGTSSESEDAAEQDAARPDDSANSERQQAAQAIPSKTFKPPSGYSAVESTQPSGAEPFSAHNLEGKQIWHITAPFNVPLASLTELALSSITSAEPVLSHKDVPYVLNEDKTVGSDQTTLLVPSKDGYTSVSSKISRTLHLQQKVDLPDLSALQASQMTGSNAAGDIAQAAVSTARPQPKGLRMRFKPPGFGRGNPGRLGSTSESGDDDEDNDEGAGPSFQFPKTLGQHGVETKQDGDVEMVDAADVEGSKERAEKPEKKAKKKRKEDQSGGVVNGETSKTAGLAATLASPARDEGLPDTTGAEKESKEERRRRKDEKRARKEAKAKKGAV